MRQLGEPLPEGLAVILTRSRTWRQPGNVPWPLGVCAERLAGRHGPAAGPGYGPAQVLAEAWLAAAGHHLCELAVPGSGTAVIAFAVSPVSKLRRRPASVVPGLPSRYRSSRTSCFTFTA